MIELYSTPRSANGRKVLALAQHLGLSPVLHDIDVYQGAGQAPTYLALNPSGKVPFLVDGDLRLSESNAILLYLAEAHGGGRLLGADAAGRATIHSWMFWEAAHWQPALTELLTPVVAHALFPDRMPAPNEAPDWSGERVAPVLAQLERQLAASEWVAGDECSVADFSLAGMTTYFGVGAFPRDAHPGIASWLDRLAALPAWTGTLAEPWSLA